MNMLDKTKSYKFVGGKFVERTAEEQANSSGEKPTAATPSRQDAEIEGAVRQAHHAAAREAVRAQVARVRLLFMILLYENFRHRGKPFILPTDKLAAVKA